MPDRPMPTSEIRERLTGAWSLVSWSNSQGGEEFYPLGRDAKGQIIYTADGHVSAQLVRSNLPAFGSGDWLESTPSERERAWLGYFGYFGPYSIDEERQSVIHHIEGAWFPNMVGTDQVRSILFRGSDLVLGAETIRGQVAIIWRKRL